MLTHVDNKNQPQMVDVQAKEVSFRQARAQAKLQLPQNILDVLEGGELHSKKGPVFQTAIIAGTMAAKKTSELIPFCHPLGLEGCKLQIEVDKFGEVTIDGRVSIHHKTGVEMEALMAVNIAALTIYDMCKAMSHDIVIKEVCLLEKTGGKSDFRR